MLLLLLYLGFLWADLIVDLYVQAKRDEVT